MKGKDKKLRFFLPYPSKIYFFMLFPQFSIFTIVHPSTHSPTLIRSTSGTPQPNTFLHDLERSLSYMCVRYRRLGEGRFQPFKMNFVQKRKNRTKHTFEKIWNQQKVILQNARLLLPHHQWHLKYITFLNFTLFISVSPLQPYVRVGRVIEDFKLGFKYCTSS